MLVTKPEGEIPLERSRRIWEDNIRVDLREMECEDVDWMHVYLSRETGGGLL